MLNVNVRVKNGFCYNFVSFINVFALCVVCTQFTCMLCWANVWIFSAVKWEHRDRHTNKNGILTNDIFIHFISASSANLHILCVCECELSLIIKTNQTNCVIKYTNSSILSCIVEHVYSSDLDFKSTGWRSIITMNA